jgi:hypothetical protein
MNPADRRNGPRDALRAQICAVLDDAEDIKDPRIVSIISLALGELVNAARNFDRLAEAAERQAEALERIHARFDLAELTCDLARLADAAQRLADLAPRIEPSCPECGAAMLRKSA